jgi:PAS domain S-box-containing protein
MRALVMTLFIGFAMYVQATAGRREEAVEAGEESRKLYRTLVENIDLGITLIDADHRIVMTNAAHGRLFHKPAREFIGRKCYREFEKRDGVCAHCPGTRAMATGKPVEVETEGVRDDGTRFSVRIHAYPLYREDGSPEGFIEVVEDITKERGAEEAIRTSEERYRSMVENLPAPICRFLPGDGTIPYVNETYCEYFGKRREELIGESFLELIPERDREKVKRHFDSLTKEHPITTYEHRVKTPRGERWQRWTDQALFGEEGNVIEYQSVGVDITEEKRIQEIQRRKEFYEQVLDGIRDAISIIDPGTYRILDANRAFLETVGLPKEAVLGKTCYEVTHHWSTPCAPPDGPCPIDDFLEGEVQSVAYEHVHFDESGDERYMEGSIYPVKDGEKIDHLIHIAKDITERKRAEEEMKRRLMRFRLEEGGLYLVKEPKPALVLEAFQDLLRVGYPGVVISRTPEETFRQNLEGDYSFLWLAEGEGRKNLSPGLKDLRGEIDALPRRHAVLIDRLDYLIFKNGFENVLAFIHRLRERAYLRSLVVLLSIDPATLKKFELSLLEKETAEVEPQEKAKLPMDLLEVLRVVYQQNSMGARPSFSDIERELDLSKPTVRKRIRQLVSGGYARTNIKGRNKIVSLTEKGRRLFWK